MTLSEFESVAKVLTIAFRTDYLDPEKPEYQLARLIFQMAQQEGMGRTEFTLHMRRFLKTAKYPTWVPADFFGIGRTKLHPYIWALEHKDELNAGLIGAYIVAGYDKPLWGYVEEIGDALERRF